MFLARVLCLALTTTAILVPRTDPDAGCNPLAGLPMTEGDDGPAASKNPQSVGIGAEVRSKRYFERKAKVAPEYILDGEKIKVGSPANVPLEKSENAGVAGEAVANDFMRWVLSPNGEPNKISLIDYPPCETWTVKELSDKNKASKNWAPQLTTAMPLEAVYSIMKDSFTNPSSRRNMLAGQLGTGKGSDQNIQLVTKDYFKTDLLPMKAKSVTDDVLGFTSLVLSYAKAAAKEKPADLKYDKSPKHFLPLLPRTEFNTIYSQVRSKFPEGVNLFEVFNLLAFYKTDEKMKLSIDREYCGGELSAPIPGNKFAGLKFEYRGTPVDEVPTTMSIKAWIEGIGAGSPKLDLLSSFDKNYGKSIGGLKDKRELMYKTKTNRAVPLFEFRDLDPIKATGFEQFMQQADKVIQKLHTKFAKIPKDPLGVIKVKRQGCTADIVTSPMTSSSKSLSASHLTFTSQSPSASHSTFTSHGSSVLLTTPTSARSTAHPSGPTVSCIYQDERPQIPAAYTCMSANKTTIGAPMTLSSVSIVTQSCDYTTWPIHAHTVTTPPQTVSTNLAMCQRCTYYAANEADCVPLPSWLGCTPLTKTIMLSADTSGVTVGTLTGTALYSAITSGIDQACQIPSNAGGATGSYTCNEDATITIAPNIVYVNDEAGTDFWDPNGSLELQVKFANYDSLEWYENTKAALAAFAQNSTQNNCRDLTADSISEESQFLPHPHYDQPTYNVCNAGSLFELQEYDPTRNSTQRSMAIGLAFHRDATEDFLCQFLEEVVEFVELAVNLVSDTEEAIPTEMRVDQELLKACEEGTALASGATGGQDSE